MERSGLRVDRFCAWVKLTPCSTETLLTTVVGVSSRSIDLRIQTCFVFRGVVVLVYLEGINSLAPALGNIEVRSTPYHV